MVLSHRPSCGAVPPLLSPSVSAVRLRGRHQRGDVPTSLRRQPRESLALRLTPLAGRRGVRELVDLDGARSRTGERGAHGVVVSAVLQCSDTAWPDAPPMSNEVATTVVPDNEVVR